MKLPKGITGIRADLSKDYLQFTNNDLRELVGIIKSYRFYKLEEVINFTPSSNYYRIKLEEIKTKSKYDLLINPIGKLSCCVTNNSEWMKLEFIECPEILTQIIQDKVKIIGPFLLNESVSEQNLIDLDKAEISQIRYWKTKRLGDIIFNGYD